MILSLDNWCTLPTPMGTFRMYDTSLETISVISMGSIQKLGNNPILRIHSSCRASEVFGALDCDCADQLRQTMKLIATEGRGLVIYQHQEGRGHGLSLKIEAVKIMEEYNLDTVEAFDKMGLDQDVRSYTEAVEILQKLKIRSVRLVSNNPRKSSFLQQRGIKISEIRTHPNIRAENKGYLHTKKNKLGHKLPLNDCLDPDGTIKFYHSDQPWGEFSNFSRHSIFINGRIWPTTEHYYQAQKFICIKLQEKIRCCLTPMQAKQVAYQLDSQHRVDWIDVREQVMLAALRAKFNQHPDLKENLLGTDRMYLMEFTDQDEYWGDIGNGSGKNRLGYLLMKVRSELKNHTYAE